MLFHCEPRRKAVKLSAFLEGLMILKQHYNGGDGYHIGAEHDVFYAYMTDTDLTPVEVDRMHALGWGQEGLEPPNYDSQEGWFAFT
jgi:hypothetical protein